MRGQKLFVRPIEAADHDAIRTFLAAHALRDAVPSCGLLGKLVGDIVAVLAMEITPDAVRVDDLVVAKDLRRKRIGRGMLAELDALAAKIDREWLVAREDHEFFRRVGFQGMRRKVSR
ncbi:MAG TPA: GNAT family N-acetyltransferase [Thermoanaerobaculia bacterium]|nr:GNAT family N-acetyltransferase [Thermoanaerobaculia bacterium]